MSATLRPNRSQMLNGTAGLLLSAGLLWLFFSRVDLDALYGALRDLDWRWVGLAAGIQLVAYLVQAARWRRLIQPAGGDLPLRRLWAATASGWTFNTLLPLRLGNVVRPWFAARWVKASFPLLLSTAVLEMVFDLWAGVVMLGLLISVWPPDIAFGGLGAGSGTGMVVLSLGLLVGLLWLSGPRQQAWLVEQLGRVPFTKRWVAYLEEAFQGLATLRSWSSFGSVVAYTAVFWFAWGLAIHVVLIAFGLNTAWVATLFVECTLAISTSVPQGPGFLGVFQWVVDEALRLWSVPAAEAQAVALVLWGVSYVPISLLGIWETLRNEALRNVPSSSD